MVRPSASRPLILTLSPEYLGEGTRKKKEPADQAMISGLKIGIQYTPPALRFCCIQRFLHARFIRDALKALHRLTFVENDQRRNRLNSVLHR